MGFNIINPQNLIFDPGNLVVLCSNVICAVFSFLAVFVGVLSMLK